MSDATTYSKEDDSDFSTVVLEEIHSLPVEENGAENAEDNDDDEENENKENVPPPRIAAIARRLFGDELPITTATSEEEDNSLIDVVERGTGSSVDNNVTSSQEVYDEEPDDSYDMPARIMYPSIGSSSSARRARQSRRTSSSTTSTEYTDEFGLSPARTPASSWGSRKKERRGRRSSSNFTAPSLYDVVDSSPGVSKTTVAASPKRGSGSSCTPPSRPFTFRALFKMDMTQFRGPADEMIRRAEQDAVLASPSSAVTANVGDGADDRNPSSSVLSTSREVRLADNAHQGTKFGVLAVAGAEPRHDVL